MPKSPGDARAKRHLASMEVIEIQRIVALRAESCPITGGVTLYSGDVPVLSVEPLGSMDAAPLGEADGVQCYIATATSGPDRGSQLRLRP